MSDSMWEVLEDIESKESGGGAIIGKVEFLVGYKCFVAGATNEESFFAFNPADEKSKEKALEAAKAFVEEHGGGSRPQVCAQFRVYKDSVLGREVTWKGDRFFTHPLWTPGYKEVVKPALKAAGVKSTGTYWGRIAFVDDPSGRQDIKLDGNLGPAQIEHLVEVYKDEAAARAAAGGSAPAASAKSTASSSSNGEAPEGWDAETWEAMKPDIKADIAGRLNGNTTPPNVAKVLQAVAKEYAVPVTFLKPLV